MAWRGWRAWEAGSGADAGVVVAAETGAVVSRERPGAGPAEAGCAWGRGAWMKGGGGGGAFGRGQGAA